MVGTGDRNRNVSTVCALLGDFGKVYLPEVFTLVTL